MPDQDDAEISGTIARLEAIVLVSVLERQPLPGLDDPVWFPDLAWITEAPTVLVSDENVPAQFSVTGTGKPIDVLKESEIRNMARDSGDKAYVRFQPAEYIAEQIRIVMEVRLAPAEPDITPLGLGGIRVQFVETSPAEWQAAEAPVMFGM